MPALCQPLQPVHSSGAATVADALNQGSYIRRHSRSSHASSDVAATSSASGPVTAVAAAIAAAEVESGAYLSATFMLMMLGSTANEIAGSFELLDERHLAAWQQLQLSLQQCPQRQDASREISVAILVTQTAGLSPAYKRLLQNLQRHFNANNPGSSQMPGARHPCSFFFHTDQNPSDCVK